MQNRNLEGGFKKELLGVINLLRWKNIKVIADAVIVMYNAQDYTNVVNHMIDMVKEKTKQKHTHFFFKYGQMLMFN